MHFEKHQVRISVFEVFSAFKFGTIAISVVNLGEGNFWVNAKAFGGWY